MFDQMILLNYLAFDRDDYNINLKEFDRDDYNINLKEEKNEIELFYNNAYSGYNDWSSLNEPV